MKALTLAGTAVMALSIVVGGVVESFLKNGSGVLMMLFGLIFGAMLAALGEL